MKKTNYERRVIVQPYFRIKVLPSLIIRFVAITSLSMWKVNTSFLLTMFVKTVNRSQFVRITIPFRSILNN